MIRVTFATYIVFLTFTIVLGAAGYSLAVIDYTTESCVSDQLSMASEYNLDSFWDRLLAILSQMERHLTSDDLRVGEQLFLRGDECMSVLRAMYGRMSELGSAPRPLISVASLDDLLQSLSSVITALHGYCDHYSEWTLRLLDCSENKPLHPPVEYTGRAGRPVYTIPRAHLESLIEISFNFQQIAGILGVSERTIRRRRAEFGLPIGDNYSRLSHTELDVTVADILEVTGDSGISLVRGALLSRGHLIQRQRVIDSLRRVDPISSSLRRMMPIHCRQYSVPGPNSLWHVDRNHKLIHWKFVIHGGIDGFSRLVVYLQCSNNNRASTVLGCFQPLYGVPSRVRCDHGVENVDIARFMITHRGSGRQAVITGSSVHNQRIECLWRDVRRVVIRQFHNLLCYMEQYSLLDSLNEAHLLALHHVFTPRINQALLEFMHQHNNHRKKTEHNLTPLQLFLTAPTPVEPLSIDLECYGVDENGPVPYIDSASDVVIVDPPQVDILPNQEAALMAIDALFDDGNFGINVYLDALTVIIN